MSEIKRKATDKEAADVLKEAVKSIDDAWSPTLGPACLMCFETILDRIALVRAHNYLVLKEDYIE